ncbi:MAG: response regulator transcription factor [Mycobacteriales bacterium]
MLLVDDHELIRQGLRRAFERAEDFTVSGEAGSVQEALARARAQVPDVVVTDVRLPDGSGIDIVRELRAQHPQLGLVVLTMFGGDEQLFSALEAGASAFVNKDAPAGDVVAAARHAIASPTAFTAQNLGQAMQRRMAEASPAKHGLSARELEVLRLLAAGSSARQLARQLYISESTVKTHISRLYDKLGAANRAQALMIAVKLGLLAGS